MSIVFGDGKGGFGSPVNYVVGTNPTEVLMGDFDGDGRMDLLTTDFGSEGVSLLKGVAAGVFKGARTIPAFVRPFGFAVADFDHDGISDLALTSSESGDIQIYLGTLSGDFRSLPSLHVGKSLRGAAVGELFGNGTLNLVAVDSEADQAIILGFGKCP